LGTRVELGTSGNLWNFKANDSATVADYAANSIARGSNSMEVWLNAYFLQPFNRVSGIRLWMSTDFSPNTGLSVFYKSGGQVIYLQPAAGTSSIATSSLPLVDPGSTNIGIGGNLSGSLVSPADGYSDHIVMQLRTTVAAATGDTSLATFTVSYDEN
jgi:hypothetical protein